MKARVKETGEIVHVDYVRGVNVYVSEDYVEFDPMELEFDVDAPDYWEKLKHQYAGMAMQGMIRTVGHDRMYPPEKIAIYAEAYAHALVEKLKEKEERKCFGSE